MIDLLKHVASIPVHFMQILFGILVALAEDTSVVLLLVAAVALTIAFGWAGIGFVFLAYAVLHTLGSVVNGISNQINYLARVHRDNA